MTVDILSSGHATEENHQALVMAKDESRYNGISEYCSQTVSAGIFLLASCGLTYQTDSFLHSTQSPRLVGLGRPDPEHCSHVGFTIGSSTEIGDSGQGPLSLSQGPFI